MLSGRFLFETVLQEESTHARSVSDLKYYKWLDASAEKFDTISKYLLSGITAGIFCLLGK
jgi:hypothetical protein